jgi:hypothetical protein
MVIIVISLLEKWSLVIRLHRAGLMKTVLWQLHSKIHFIETQKFKTDWTGVDKWSCLLLVTKLLPRRNGVKILLRCYIQVEHNGNIQNWLEDCWWLYHRWKSDPSSSGYRYYRVPRRPGKESAAATTPTLFGLKLMTTNKRCKDRFSLIMVVG